MPILNSNLAMSYRITFDLSCIYMADHQGRNDMENLTLQ